MKDWFFSTGGDLSLFIISAAIIGAYQYFLHVKSRRNPTYTIQAVNVMARTVWVENVMSRGDKDILAVQTLRNSTMAATLMASTAVVLIIGVLSLSGQADKLSSAWHVLNAFGATHTEVWVMKIMALLLDFFVAFFCFSMAVRLLNHVGYMINVPVSMSKKQISPDHVAMYLNQSGKYYSMGMRTYYFSVPLVFWLFGPHLMFISTLALIFILYHIDRAPRFLADDYK